MDQSRSPHSYFWDVLTFVLPGDQAVGIDLCNHVPIMWPCSPLKVVASCKTAPVGADLKYKLYLVHNGVPTELIAQDTYNYELIIGDAMTAGLATAFEVGAIAIDDYIRIDCTSVGSTTPGADVTIRLQMRTP
ncbi:MAG: hypothetical protein ABFD94_15085 [Armatimonadia bacterium]